MGQPKPVPDYEMMPASCPASAPVRASAPVLAFTVVLLVLCYFRTFFELYRTWVAPDSYYLHGFLIPPVSLFFVWRRRRELLSTQARPSWLGHAVVGVACLMLLLGDVLGLRFATQLSFVVMLTGLVLAFWGTRHLAIVWFPIVFLLMMIPVPASVIQSVSLTIKLFAAETAVRMARLAFLPIVREGSYVYFGDDHFIIGDVCGGLRSLISLLSVGAVVAYISNARAWARVVLFILSGPIAVIANVVRIFLLCVVGYHWGSKTATGNFHDISGLVIFLVAFILLFALDSLLRKIAPERAES
jgi:exosortase